MLRAPSTRGEQHGKSLLTNTCQCLHEQARVGLLLQCVQCCPGCRAWPQLFWIPHLRLAEHKSLKGSSICICKRHGRGSGQRGCCQPEAWLHINKQVQEGSRHLASALPPRLHASRTSSHQKAVEGLCVDRGSEASGVTHVLAVDVKHRLQAGTEKTDVSVPSAAAQHAGAAKGRGCCMHLQTQPPPLGSCSAVSPNTCHQCPETLR